MSIQNHCEKKVAMSNGTDQIYLLCGGEGEGAREVSEGEGAVRRKRWTKYEK